MNTNEIRYRLGRVGTVVYHAGGITTAFLHAEFWPKLIYDIHHTVIDEVVNNSSDIFFGQGAIPRMVYNNNSDLLSNDTLIVKALQLVSHNFSQPIDSTLVAGGIAISAVLLLPYLADLISHLRKKEELQDK